MDWRVGRDWRRMLGFAGVLLAIPLGAAAEIRAEVTQFGQIAAADRGPMQPGQTIHALSEGRLIGDLAFITRTDDIPARLCLRFGSRIRLVRSVMDRAVTVVQVTVHHPEMRRPDGAASTEDSFLVSPEADTVTAAFSFDHDWEMVAGTWRWDFAVGGRVIASQTFQVSAPADAVRPGTVCEGPPSA